MLLEKHIDVPIRIRGTYNAATKYNVGDVVRFVISGVSKGWLLMVDAPAGTAPRANSAYWVEFTAALAETRGAQGLPAPAPQVRYSDDGNVFRPNYVDGDLFREVSYDDGTTWTRERIRGDRGIQGIPGVARDGIDGTNAPLVIWQYAADPPDDVTPIEWRDNYVQGDVWKHWSNDGGTTWGPPERILGRDGRDGFDLERQYSDSASGPWEVHDTGQEWIRERVGNVDPFGPPIQRSGDAHTTSEVTTAQAREIAAAAARARYTDDEKTKVGTVETGATADQTPEEIRDALESLGIDLNDEIVNMRDGLRDATADDYLKLGLGPDGKLYRVKRTANPGHDARGMLNEYTNPNFRGVSHGRPDNPQVGQTYYNIRISQWYLFFRNQVVAIIDAQPITPIQALGANTEWIGEVDDQYQAIHAIEDFDNTKAYYAVYGETLYVLDNSTYSAPTGVTYSYEWVEAIPDDVVTTEELNAAIAQVRSEIPAVVGGGEFYVDITPRYCRVDQLRGVLVFVFTNVPAKYNTANLIEVLIDGSRAYRSGWDTDTTYLRFDIIEQTVDNIISNTTPDQAIWDVEVKFLNGQTELGRERTPLIINRSPAPTGGGTGASLSPEQEAAIEAVAGLQTAVSENRSAIQSNDTDIGENRTAIESNDTDISTLRTDVDAKPDDDDVTRIADERAAARFTDEEQTQVAKIEEIEGEIDALQAVTENIPLSADVLWATSKVLATTETNAIVDVDWTLTDEVPTGVVIAADSLMSGDIIDIPKSIRGELHVDIVDGDDNLIQRLAVDLHVDNFTFKDIYSNRLRVAVSESVIDDTKLSVWLDNVSTITFDANTTVKIYGVVSLPRVDISGIRTRIDTAETELAALKSQVSNIPVSQDVLWLTSPVLNTRGGLANVFPQSVWTLGDDAPAGISGFGNMISLPSDIRGDLHFEYYIGENLQGRALVPIHTTETGTVINLRGAAGVLATITVSATTSGSITITPANIRVQNNTTIRVYGVSALPVSEVAGVTQAQLNAALRPFDVDVFPKLTKIAAADFVKTFVLEFGRVPPEIARANRLIVTINGSPVYNGLPTGGFTDNKVLPLPVTDRQINNIITNIQPTDETLIVNINFRLNNEPANLASRSAFIVIDRN